MKGSEAKMLGFMEGADKRYVILVHQRKYNWKYENCQQLFLLSLMLVCRRFLCMKQTWQINLVNKYKN